MFGACLVGWLQAVARVLTQALARFFDTGLGSSTVTRAAPELLWANLKLGVGLPGLSQWPEGGRTAAGSSRSDWRVGPGRPGRRRDDWPAGRPEPIVGELEARSGSDGSEGLTRTMREWRRGPGLSLTVTGPGLA